MIDPGLAYDLIKEWGVRRNTLHQQMTELDLLYRCEADYDPSDGTSAESGLLFAHVDNMAASVCPLNPKIVLKASRVSSEEYARNRQRVINAEFRRLKMAAFVRRAAIKAAVFPRTIAKAIWDMKSGQVKFRSIDLRRFMFDLETEEWEDLTWVCELVVMSESAWKEKIQMKSRVRRKMMYDIAQVGDVKGAAYPEYCDGEDADKTAMRAKQTWVKVYQFYDLTGVGQFMEFVEDIKEPILTTGLPYRNVQNPFYIMSFNANLTDMRGFSDAQVIRRPLHRLSELRTLKNEFVRSSLPLPIIDDTGVDEPDKLIEDLENADGSRTIIRVKVNQGKTIGDVISYKQAPSLSPAFSDMEQSLREDILFRIGMPEYSRGAVGGSDVATEFALANAADQTRRGYKMETLNNLIIWAARSIVGLLQEFMQDSKPYPVGKEEGEESEQAYEDMTRAMLGFDSNVEESIVYDLTAYSGLDGNPGMLLQKLMSASKILLGNPNINQAELMRWLVRVLEAPPALYVDAPPPAPGMPPGMPGAGGAPMPGPGGPGGPTDSMAGGGMPQGVPKVPLPPLPGMKGGEGNPSPVPMGLGKGG